MTEPDLAALALREVIESDLEVFYQQMLDPTANFRAAFTAPDRADKTVFARHWAKIRADDTTTIRTIVYNGLVVGHVASFRSFGELEVTYWLGREFWGQGLATQALTKFLTLIKSRPVYGRAASDNLASIRVLEKCGFVKIGTEQSFANARGCEIEETILELR